MLFNINQETLFSIHMLLTSEFLLVDIFLKASVKSTLPLSKLISKVLFVLRVHVGLRTCSVILNNYVYMQRSFSIILVLTC